MIGSLEPIASVACGDGQSSRCVVVKIRAAYSLAFLIALVTTICFVFAIEVNARKRVDTARTHQGCLPVQQIVAMLGRPIDAEFQVGTGLHSFSSYYAGLDWRWCLARNSPYVRLPNRTWIILETNAANEMVTVIWWKSGGMWQRLYPKDDVPGAPPAW